MKSRSLISAVRDQALALAALRHGLPSAQSRGFDGLPNTVKSEFEGALVGSLDVDELRRALRAATHRLLLEVGRSDRDLAASLEGPLTELSQQQA